MNHRLHHSHQPHVKRLQHEPKSDLRLTAYQHQTHPPSSARTNSFEYRSPLPNDEVVRESIQNFTIAASHSTKPARSFQPAPQRARRGGGQSHDRSWHSSVSLPKRAINYDLAESFIDHSTNPLSSDFYQKKFKHSPLQWPNGRFITYKDKLNKLDGTIVDINCTRTLPTVSLRKKNSAKESIITTTTTERNGQINDPQNTTTSSFDPIAQELKKKQVDKQKHLYANLFGSGRISQISSVNQMKKIDSAPSSSTSSASISLHSENAEVHQS